MLLLTATPRLLKALFETLSGQVTVLAVVLWDLGLCLANIVLPSTPRGKLYPAGALGHGGKWPEYIPPGEGDSRSACPMLNAMANHGILPRDGKNIPFAYMGQQIRKTYNFAPSFCYFVPSYMAQLLRRSYRKDTLDLSDISVHNGIEHDASLCRHDTFLQPDQSKPAHDLITEMLAYPTREGRTSLTAADIAAFMSKRRADSRVQNGQHTLSTFHKIFGSSNSATMLLLFGGDVETLKTVLHEERLPDGYESTYRKPFGLTLAAFNATVLQVELGVKEPEVDFKAKKIL
ncbi:heme-thiolate peroxidase [Punctularia strigosozonata HHB-11173 SS5]|uniref:Heme-thiolate peroxidase n=1 Tax=Punctularia strigosozonata (strain HHB-11173) TaxID=741275 RepID=R7S391_PUNST|nr:heme-thiolate peroxidase [Punctularia strigosozonata HHB-11173 SS5]EIN04232.1 heme-thiolate peroxidase [Punctularia strigosozonata HHB-11173 SS5]